MRRILSTVWNEDAAMIMNRRQTNIIFERMIKEHKDLFTVRNSLEGDTKRSQYTESMSEI